MYSSQTSQEKSQFLQPALFTHTAAYYYSPTGYKIIPNLDHQRVPKTQAMEPPLLRAVPAADPPDQTTPWWPSNKAPSPGCPSAVYGTAHWQVKTPMPSVRHKRRRAIRKRVRKRKRRGIRNTIPPCAGHATVALCPGISASPKSGSVGLGSSPARPTLVVLLRKQGTPLARVAYQVLYAEYCVTQE